MDWGVTVAGLGLVLALLSAWGSAAYAIGRASAVADLKVSEAEGRLRGHVEIRIEKAIGDRRGEMDKLWGRIEHAAESQSHTTAQLAAIQTTLKHIEGALERLERLVARPRADAGGDD